MNLSNVTLIAISSVEIPRTIEALSISARDLNFGDIKLVSHEKPNNLPSNINYEYAPKINNIMDFNYYLFSEFGKHIETSHCLIVQYHGYIINPEMWEDSWLEYDCIGAPWPIKENSYIANNGERVRVGNGGFTLRSKRLCELPKKLSLQLKEEQGYWNEDGNICCYHRKELLENGVNYAPVEVAAKFSFETLVPENQYLDKTFGFHRNILPAGEK